MSFIKIKKGIKLSKIGLHLKIFHIMELDLKYKDLKTILIMRSLLLLILNNPKVTKIWLSKFLFKFIH